MVFESLADFHTCVLPHITDHYDPAMLRDDVGSKDFGHALSLLLVVLPKSVRGKVCTRRPHDSDVPR